jgi:hypothetical protein
VTHTGLEVGATVFLDYTVHSNAEFMPFLMGNESLQEPVGIKNLQIIVKIPETMELQHQVYNLRTGAEEELSDGQKKYSWTFRELKPNYNEAFQNDDKAPRLVFSTSADMERSFFAFVNQNAFRHKLNDGIKGVVKKIVEENENDLEIMKALQKVVVNDIKLIDVDAKYTGFRCRTPKQVWESGNATELEKSILLSDMLIEAGINAFSVGAIRSRFYDKEKANLLLFNHFYVQVNPKKADRQYLSVTSLQEQNMLYAMNKNILIQLDGAIEKMRTFHEKPIMSGIGIEGEIVISDTNLAEGKFELTLEGAVNPFYNLPKDSALVRKYMKTGNALKTEVSTISRLTESKTTAEFLTKGTTFVYFEGYYFFELPHSSGGIDKWHLDGIPSSRETPMELPYPIYESNSYKVTLPEGSRLLTRPIKLEIKNAIGQASILLSLKDEEVKLVRQFEINQVMVEPHQYGYLLQLLEAYYNKNYTKLIFTYDE